MALARGVSIAPGPIFSAREAFRRCFRVNCGFPWQAQLERAVRTLGELCRRTE
jgi:DNA-binding transcriptional MocR family regulator